MPSVYRKTNSPFWYANIKAYTGKQKNYSTGVRDTGAESFKRAMRVALEDEEEQMLVRRGKKTPQELIASKLKLESIEPLIDTFLQTVPSERQRVEIRSTLGRFIDEHRIQTAGELGQPPIVGETFKFLQGMQTKRRSPDWIRKSLAYVQRFGDWLWRNGFVQSNETLKVKPLDSRQEKFFKYRAFTPAEALLLIESPQANLFTGYGEDDPIPRKRRLYYHFRLFTGARGTEEFGVRRADLDLAGGASKILWRHEITKNDHQCELPLAPSLVRELAEQVGMMHPGRVVFEDIESDEDKRLRVLRADCTAVGIDHKGILERSFRKTFCTFMERAGIELGKRMKFRRDVGQGSVKLANWTYSDNAQVMPELRSDIERFDRWFTHEAMGASVQKGVG